MKKASKIICGIFLVIILLFAFFISICFFSNKDRQNKSQELLTKRGYCNLVDTGDIKLNVPIIGFESPDHTVVCMGGSEDSTFAPAINNLAAYVHGNLRYAVIERPGYGMSDVAKQDMTVEYIVESSRKALISAEIKGPYILLAHSLGGMYAEYWFNKYPEEVEGVLLIDTVFPGDKFKSVAEDFNTRLINAYESLGILNMFCKEELPLLAKMLPDKYHDTARILSNYRPNNSSLSSELSLIEKNLETVDSVTQLSDIPKVYISTDTFELEEYKTAMQFEFDAAGRELTDETINNRFDQYCNERNADFIDARNLYLSRLGNVTHNNIPSSHFIYLQYPNDVAVQLEMLVDRVEHPVEE